MMDTQRTILLVVFMMSLFMLWDAWQKQHVVQNPLPNAQNAAPSAPANPADSIPKPLSSPASPSTGSAQAPATRLPEGEALKSSARVHVRTDVLEADISVQGGDLVGLALLRHGSTHDRQHPFPLFEVDGAHTYVAQAGFALSPEVTLPTHKTVYRPEKERYELQAGQDSVTVRLEAPTVDGVAVTRSYTFRRGSYLIETGFEIRNGSARPLAPVAYFHVLRDGKPVAEETSMLSTFTGFAAYTEAQKYKKIKFDDIAAGKAGYVKEAKDGWLALVQHYFVSAWIPPVGTEREYYLEKVGELYRGGVKRPVGTIAQGASGTVSMSLYAGPLEQEKLESVAPGLNLAVDYGWLTIIAAPLFWVLSWFHKLLGNWGWSIVVLTVMLKLLFFPLSAASYKSMAKMRLVTPKLTKLKEQYGDDRARMNQEMMELYKKEKINPLGGCLPILVQIPVFIALYWVLLGSVEMRQAPWALWIDDLSTKDPYFVLPLLMGATMFIQTKLNPTPPDPIQAKVMLLMPVVFTAMFLFFPSGLVLYWTVNNLLSIAQQWQITRMIEGGKQKSGQ